MNIIGHKHKSIIQKMSLRLQLIVFSIIVSVIIGGIAYFVLTLNNATLKNDSDYLEYISKINILYQVQEENSKLIYQIIDDLDEISQTELKENIKTSYQLLDELEAASTSVNLNLRLKVAAYLLKRFEKHVEEMIWLRNFDNDEQINTKSPYYEMYQESSSIITRINTYLQEILRYSVDENQEFINKSKQNNKFLQVVLISFVALILIASIVFYLLFANYMTKLINYISNMTKHILEGDNKNEIINLTGPKEISELTISFNSLLDTIYKLYKDREEKSKLELLLSEEERKKTALELRLAEEELEQIKYHELLKESQLQGLQLQIKPHFLFNTLNVISMTALLENADKAHELIVALSKFMRYSLKEVKSKINLSEEIDMVSRYLYILKARMGDQFVYTINCTGNLDSIKIPMFTLQPIVENAFKHGVEDKLEQGKITLRIKKNKNILHLSVYDNGKGMTKDKKNEIKQMLLPHPVDFSHTAHIGIENVGYRLNMFFEDNVKYLIYSSKRRGTVFTIQITLD